MIQNAEILPADALIFDLEDSVAAEDKDAARDLVGQALRSLDFGSRECLVRINDPEGEETVADLRAMVAAGAHGLMVPKVRGPETMKMAADLLSDAERALGQKEGSTALVALIESAVGVERAFQIAGASDRITALALGGEDLAADLGCPRTPEGREIFYARSRLVMAARAAGIEALDTPFTDIDDLAACEADARLARQLGFAGKLCISPFHLEAIHRAFTPQDDEVALALDQVKAMREGARSGQGAVSFRGRMLDPPVLRQAERILALAVAAGLLDQEEVENVQG